MLAVYTVYFVFLGLDARIVAARCSYTINKLDEAIHYQ